MGGGASFFSFIGRLKQMEYAGLVFIGGLAVGGFLGTVFTTWLYRDENEALRRATLEAIERERKASVRASMLELELDASASGGRHARAI